MTVIHPLQPDCYYHIYNRGNNGENLFREERNYLYFLELYHKYIDPIADTFGFCLLKNHFHLLARIKKTVSASLHRSEDRAASLGFSNLFNAYAKAINKAYGRTGSLFEDRFERQIVQKNSYLLHLVYYIHFNPQKHGFVDDFRKWPWSSYPVLVKDKTTWLNRSEVLEWFGSLENFELFHNQDPMTDVDFIFIDA